MMFKTITATLAFGAGLCTANADTLSLQLLRTLAQESTGNLAFSPAGAENVLRALRQYSAGETLRELDALGIASPGTYNVHIEQADGLFVAQKLPLVPGIKEPVRVDFQHNQQAADTINTRRAAGGRVIAVGTTSCRTLESASDEEGRVQEVHGDTGIFIYPGYRFKAVDALITNFHLPESTLLMLVSALAGKEYIMSAYRTAVKEKYRFFSFGDAMFIQ